MLPEAATRSGLVFALLLWALVLPACSRKLPRDTPEATIASARMVVEAGKAGQLSDFIYADSEDMKKLLRRTGKFLDNIQALGTAVQERFPDDVAKLKAQAEQQAAAGKSQGLLTLLSQNMGGNMGPPSRRRNADPKREQETREALEASIKRLFADPYAFLRESEGKLTTMKLSDNAAALMWDGKPILPPLGMTMQKGDDDRWYFVLPTNAPGISSVMPKSKDQFQMLGGIIQILDNVAIDLRKDVVQGRVGTMDDLARKAGEKAFLPAVIGFYAYGKYEAEIRKDSGKQPGKIEVKIGGPDSAAPPK